MDAIEAILTRRSIRKYTQDPVSEETIEKLLEAAMAAPSAGNQQPWHFIVIRDREILDEIPKLHPYAQMVKEAPVAIVVCGDERSVKYKIYWPQDCAAATQNLLLAAHAQCLGAVWCGVYPNEERVSPLRELLHIPEYIFPFSLVAIGYPGEEKPSANRYDTSRAHTDRWDQSSWSDSTS